MSNLIIVPREKWATRPKRGASYVRHYVGIPSVLHWFGPGSAATGTARSTAQARSFMDHHMLRLGWSDIGYNYLILRDNVGGLATVLEGRGDNVRGAHSGSNVGNARPGICIMVGTGTPAPTDAQLDALQNLAVMKGWGRYTGHREYYSTACPGPVLWPWLQSNRTPTLPDGPQPGINRYYFEEQPFQPSNPDHSGNGPYVRTYRNFDVRNDRLALLESAGNVVTAMGGPGEDGERLYYIYQWRNREVASQPYKFGDWWRESEEARIAIRDQQQKAREKSTGRVMRPYRNNTSVYPKIGR